ncbi:MAG: hypothetical protein DRJ05_00110, partial [Bacteroidetes bacterium]
MRNQKNTIIVSGSILVLFFIVIRYVTGFNGLYGQDSYDYLRFTKALAMYFETATDPGSFFWPVNYPFFGAIISLIFPSEIIALQLLTYLSFVFSGFLIYKIIEIIYQTSRKTIIVYLTLFFLLSPYLLRAGVVIMSDMLALAFSLSAFLSIVHYLKFEWKPYFLMALAFSLLAGFTRHHAFVILIIPMAYAAFMVIKKRGYLLVLYSILISIVVVFPTIWFKGNEFSNFTDHQWFTDWSPLNWFKNTFTTSDGLASYRFPNIVYGFFYLVHPGFLFVGVVLVSFVRKIDFNKSISRMVLAMIMLNGFFIAGVPFQNLRFHILIYPFAMILLFPAFERLIGKVAFKRVFSRMLIIFVVSVQITLFVYLFEKFNSSNKLEKAIATTVGTYPGNPVYVFAIDQAINTYSPEKNINNIWHKKYENFQPGSLFLFNEQKFGKQ